MAKKSRTPPPPRRVQAPKTRTEARASRSPDDRRKLLVLGAVSASGVVILAVVIGLLALRGGGGGAGAAKSALAKAGCTYHEYPATSQRHVTSLTAKVKYTSFPPTSGPHYLQPALWGIYTSPLVQIQSVHNLEHGGIVLQYGPKVPRSDVDAISAFYSDSPNGMLVAPLPALGSRISLAAWTADPAKLASRDAPGYHGTGHLALCTRFDERAFKVFRSAFRAKGPERYPLSALQPGS